jgi:hypothetical protein
MTCADHVPTLDDAFGKVTARDGLVAHATRCRLCGGWSVALREPPPFVYGVQHRAYPKAQPEDAA